MRFKQITTGRTRAVGIEIPLPNAPLVLVLGSKGFLMCGYLDVAAAERLGDAAAVVKGVKSVEELLQKLVVSLTPKASKLGVRIGMTGRKALSKLL
jgi:uncharacterized protein YunC (DUF1805 family)